RWNVKHEPRRTAEAERVIVLKTVFNDAWESFNIHELSEAMIQPIREYTANWVVRDSAIPVSPKDLAALIPSSNLTNFQQVKEGLTTDTAPLLERTILYRDDEGEMRADKFNLLNYKYWIIGDRRFLLSRKRTSNVGDLVTQW
ncbi:hypothetical protein L210DRAFT_786956, partial [Boletus edulis BED1]